MKITINNSVLKRADSIFLITLSLLICVLVAFLKEMIFPEKYFFDSLTLQYAIEHPLRARVDQSFGNTAKFYEILKIDKYFLAPVLALIVYFVVIYKLFRNYSVNYISLFSFIIITVYCCMAMVYLSTYSKDFVLFLFIIVPFVFLEKKNLIVWTFFVIFYAYFFRTYWFISIALFWGVRLFIVHKPRLMILFIPVYYVLIAFVYNYIFGTPLSLIRYITNLDRDADSAQTAIAIFINGDNFFLEAVNYFVTLIFLILPIPLLIMGKPFYIILTLLISVFFFYFIKLYLKENKNRSFYNIFSFVISFMLVQSLFEPDYGSFVRHLAPLYPLIFVCIAKNTKLLQEDELE